MGIEYLPQVAKQSPLDGRAPTASEAMAGSLDPTNHYRGGASGSPAGPGGREAAIGIGVVPNARTALWNVYRSRMRRSDAIDGNRRTNFAATVRTTDGYTLPDDGRGFPSHEAGWHPVNERDNSTPSLTLAHDPAQLNDGGVPTGSFWTARPSRWQFVRAYNPNREMACDDGLGGRKNWNDPGVSVPRGLIPESDGPRRNRNRNYPQFAGAAIPTDDPTSSYVPYARVNA